MVEVGSLEAARAVLFVVSRVGGLTTLEIAEEAGVEPLDALIALFAFERLKTVRMAYSYDVGAAFWFPVTGAYRLGSWT